jgi:uncharacterized protein (TIGR03089 family)
VIELVSGLLRRRIRADGASPLITYYGVGAGERVELSALTLGNWVAKASNLLAWELSVAPGDPVAMPLAQSDPGHWITAVWQLAIWQVGAYVELSASDEAAVLVCGPDWEPYAAARADVLACSLHPFATGLGATALGPTGLAASVVDADLAVRGQPDSFSAAPPDPAAPAWLHGERRWTQAELVAGPGSSARRLLIPTLPWPTARDGILAALIGGGSVVVVVGGSPDDLTRIAAAELTGPYVP